MRKRQKESWTIPHPHTGHPIAVVPESLYDALEAKFKKAQKALGDAADAAAEDGIHMHRGTDEPRRFFVILVKAMRDSLR